MVLHSASSAAITRGFEAAFKGGTGVAHLFGKEVKGNGLEWNVNQQALGQLYTPEITDFIYNRNVGQVSMEYVLANPWFFTGVFNDPVKDSTGAPQYKYTWTTDPSVNTSIRQPKTQHLVIAQLQSGASDETRNAKGAITTSLSLKSAIDQPVTVSESIQWGHEDGISTTFPVSLPTDESFTPMNFVQADVELPNSTILATVQDWELNIDSGYELYWGMGSADAADVVAKAITITGKINKGKQDSTLLSDVIGRAPIANMRIFITNGLSAGNLKSVEILLTNVSLGVHRTNGLTPSDIVLEDVDFQAERCQITAINGQSITVPMV